MRFLPSHAVFVKWSRVFRLLTDASLAQLNFLLCFAPYVYLHSNEPATLLNERTNQKIKIFNYVVGMKRCISLLKSASHSATLSFQPTLTEKKSLVY